MSIVESSIYANKDESAKHVIFLLLYVLLFQLEWQRFSCIENCGTTYTPALC